MFPTHSLICSHKYGDTVLMSSQFGRILDYAHEVIGSPAMWTCDYNNELAGDGCCPFCRDAPKGVATPDCAEFFSESFILWGLTMRYRIVKNVVKSSAK